MDVAVWLRSLGLGKYEAVFRENDIDETVLPNSARLSAATRSVLLRPCSASAALSRSTWATGC